MLYLLAIVIPPLALLLSGKPFQALISAVLWIPSVIFALLGGGLLWIILAVHALFVVRDRNTRKMMEDMQRRD